MLTTFQGAGAQAEDSGRQPTLAGGELIMMTLVLVAVLRGNAGSIWATYHLNLILSVLSVSTMLCILIKGLG